MKHHFDDCLTLLRKVTMVQCGLYSGLIQSLEACLRPVLMTERCLCGRRRPPTRGARFLSMASMNPQVRSPDPAIPRTHAHAHTRRWTLLYGWSLGLVLLIYRGVFLFPCAVNSISFAPHEFGLALACASSDGNVSVLTHQPDDSWKSVMIRHAHEMGVNAVCWSPAGSLTGVLYVLLAVRGCTAF